MSSLESSLHSQPKTHQHQRQSSSSCTPPPSSSPSSLKNSGSGVVSSPVNQSTERTLKDLSHQNATVLSLGQSFVMLPPNTRMGSLNVPHDVLEANLEFGQNDFSSHYGNPGDPQNMFLFAQNPFLPDIGNKFSSHLSGQRDVSLQDAIELAQREKYIKDRLTPVQQAQEDSSMGGNKSIIMIPNSQSVISSVSRYSNSAINSTITSTTNIATSIVSSGFSRPNVLHFQGGNGPNAMLGSAVYAGEGDLLNDGGLEVPGSTGFNSLDGILSGSIGNNSNSNSIRLPDLLDREVSQEGYLDVSGSSASLRLSPNTFDPPANTFEERSRLGVISNNGSLSISAQHDGNKTSSSEVSTSTSNAVAGSSASSANSFPSSDKLRVKPKPTKVTSPSGRVGTQPCPTCGKVFSNSSALTKHKLTHSDERKFVCQLCAKAFKRQDHLNGHMLTHRNKKPYECDVGGCGKSYCDARSLRRHKENHHNNSSTNPNLPGATTTALIPVQVGSNCVIPTIPHLNLNSLQSAFSSGLPRVVSNGGENSSTSNRIRYAPPLSQETSTLSQILGSILPSAATQLQFLAFHQTPTPPPPPSASLSNHHQQPQNQIAQPRQIHRENQLPTSGQLQHNQQQQNELQASQLQQQHTQLQQNQLQPNLLQQSQNQIGQQNQLHQQNQLQSQNQHQHPNDLLQQNQLQHQNILQQQNQLQQHNQLQQNQLQIRNQLQQQNQMRQNPNQNDSPNNSSQAIDLTSVASTTCTNSAQIVTISQDSANVSNASWQHTFQSLMMNETFEESLKRSKELEDEQLSSSISKKLSLNNAIVKNEVDCDKSNLDQCVTSNEIFQAYQSQSSPSRTNLLDYTQTTSSNLTHLNERRMSSSDRSLDCENGNSLTVKTEAEDEKEMIAPLLQQLLTPVDPQQSLLNSQSKENSRSENLDHSRQSFTSNDEAIEDHVNEDWNSVSCQPDSLSSYCSSDIPKAVECSLCQRKFKNVPALNGHMRLHGGYFKKEGENKKLDKKSSNSAVSSQPGITLQTASVNVRALIEEKIIQRQQRIGKTNEMTESVPETPISEPMNELSSSTCDLPFISEESYTLSIPDPPSLEDEESDCLLVTTQQESDEFQNHQLHENPFEANNTSSIMQMEPPSLETTDSSISAINKLPSSQFKPQFRVPRPVGEKYRRHSDSDHFVSMKRPCTDHVSSAVASFLRRKKVAARRTTRTGSDPGGDFNQFFSSAFTGTDFDLDSYFNNTALQAESLPSTPTYRQVDLFSSYPTPSDQQCGTQFPFLDRDLVLTSLENPSLPSGSEFLVYENQSDQRCIDGEHDSNLLDNSANPSTSVFQEGDLIENSYSSLCPSINALLDDPIETETPLEDSKRNLPKNSADNLTTLQVKEEQDEKPPDFINNVKDEVPNDTAWPNPADDTEDDVFLSPVNIPTSPIKPRVKHRPEPLFIPPHVNTGGGGVFASRLRSPRLRECSIETKTLSPPPYTPPPMLSPVRNGPGLFWHILSTSSGGNVTPKSAPITPNLLSRKISLSEEPIEEEVSDTPETDVLPHVNIGSQFQAHLPICRDRKGDIELKLLSDKADKVWHPSVIKGVPDEEVDSYLELACTSVVAGGGRNKEYALHILQLTGGNIEEAILKLMEPNPKLPKDHPLLTYKYLETDKWLAEQSDGFHQALMKFDKDFFSISKELGTKTVKECVQFYYIWKKLHPEEYKRVRTLRRKREQESLFYNLRPKSNNNNNNNEEEQPTADIDGQFETVNDLLSAKISFMLPSPAGSPSGRSASPASTTGDNPGTVIGHFPCKICGKVFPKVKSRSAHMKSHRQPDADKISFSSGKLGQFQSHASSK